MAITGTTGCMPVYQSWEPSRQEEAAAADAHVSSSPQVLEIHILPFESGENLEEISRILADWIFVAKELHEKEQPESAAKETFLDIRRLARTMWSEIKICAGSPIQKLIAVQGKEEVQAIAALCAKGEIRYLISAPWNVRCESAVQFAEEDNVERVSGAATGCLLGAIKADPKVPFSNLQLDSFESATAFYQKRRFRLVSDPDELYHLELSSEEAERLFEEHAWKYRFQPRESDSNDTEIKGPLQVKIAPFLDEKVRDEVAKTALLWKQVSRKLLIEEDKQSLSSQRFAEVYNISSGIHEEIGKTKYEDCQKLILVMDAAERIQAMAIVRFKHQILYLVSAPWNVRCESAMRYAKEHGIPKVSGAGTGGLLGAIKANEDMEFSSLELEPVIDAIPFYQSRYFKLMSSGSFKTIMHLDEDKARQLFEEHAEKYSFSDC